MSLCMPGRHTRRAYVELYSFLTSALDGGDQPCSRCLNPRAQSLSGHSEEEQKLFPPPWNNPQTTQPISMSVFWVHYLGSLKCIPELKSTPVQNAEQFKSSLPICQWTSKFHLLLTEITQPIHSIKITTIPHHIQVLLSVTYCTLPNCYTLLSVTYYSIPWYTLLKAKGHYMWTYSEHKV
jgi:hypothetical protein